MAPGAGILNRNPPPLSLAQITKLIRLYHLLQHPDLFTDSNTYFGVANQTWPLILS